MFDIGGVELLVIAVVAIIVVGPKDLPGLLRRVGKMVTKARGMAGEFKSHFDEVADQEEFREIRESLESVKDLSPTNQIKKAMSPFEEAGSSIRDSINSADDTSSSEAPGEKNIAAVKKPAKKAVKKKAAPKSAAPKSKKIKTASVKTKTAPKKGAKKTPAGNPPKVAEKAGA